MERNLNGTGALMLWLDVDPALRAETDEWYAREHLPDRVDPGGYRCARRYAAIAAAREYLTFFVADTPDALASPGYLGLVQKISTQSAAIRAGFRGVERNTFRIGASHCLGVGGVAATLRVRPGSLQARASLVAELACRQGVVAVHLLAVEPEIRRRMDAVRITGLDDAATGDVIMVEAVQESDLAALRDGVLAPNRIAALDMEEESYGTWRLQIDVSR